MGETFIVLGETILVLGETICAKLVMGETRYNRDKVAASSWIVKVKITKNLPKSFVTTVTV